MASNKKNDKDSGADADGGGGGGWWADWGSTLAAGIAGIAVVGVAAAAMSNNGGNRSIQSQKQPQWSQGYGDEDDDDDDDDELINRNHRSMQMNPNNAAYWRSRDFDKRPDHFQTVIDKNKRDGDLWNRANRGGHVPKANRLAMGEDIRVIESIAKQVYGRDAKVFKGGSMGKKINVPGSDLDLKIIVTKRATQQQREQFQRLVQDHPDLKGLEKGVKVDVVYGKSGDIDVLPSDAVYYPDNFKLDKLNHPFRSNDVGAAAVRNIKIDSKELQVKVPGIHVERAVLSVQQKNRGIGLGHLIDLAKNDLQETYGYQLV